MKLQVPISDYRRMTSRTAWFIGIDLAGSPKRPTGICRLRGTRVESKVAFGDDEILDFIGNRAATYVGIDAPLFLPLGRCCLRDDCTCPRDIHFRECDLELRRRGIRFFPITLGPMRLLTARGMKLAATLAAKGHMALETYPGAAQDLWGIPRQKDVSGLRRGLRRFVDFDRRRLTCHELDAVTCALLARDHAQGRTELIGHPDEGWMVLPSQRIESPSKSRHPQQGNPGKS
jgi:predicted nuclease with RNAse H fold